jgi:[phosphatase 2A protein]-leucine-carboxy methyltransferase
MLIHLLGTYVRTRAIDRLVTSFLSSKTDKVKQIISLGAGKDTRYFRLVKELKSARFIYHELDFTTNTSEKVKLIKRTPELISTITAYSEKPVDEITFTEDQLFSSTYNIHAIDLRTISSTGLPSLQNLNPSAPTLILSECCLCYLSPTHNVQILEAFTQHLIPAPTPLSIVIYEPIRPNDNFGRVMVSNLASRGIVLQTLQKFENLVAQQSRLKNAGFTSSQHAADVNFIWDQWVDAEEKERVARCEMLDEIEEWILLAKHYCIVWGWREPDHEELIGEAWSELQSQDED